MTGLSNIVSRWQNKSWQKCKDFAKKNNDNFLTKYDNAQYNCLRMKDVAIEEGVTSRQGSYILFFISMFSLPFKGEEGQSNPEQ